MLYRKWRAIRLLSGVEDISDSQLKRAGGELLELLHRVEEGRRVTVSATMVLHFGWPIRAAEMAEQFLPAASGGDITDTQLNRTAVMVETDKYIYLY